MGKLKKIKKLAAQTRRDVDRAERAAERAEQAHRRIAALTGSEVTVGDDRGDTAAGRGRFYTSPAGHDVTPAAAEITR